jgi:hypothetical protein
MATLIRAARKKMRELADCGQPLRDADKKICDRWY